MKLAIWILSITSLILLGINIFYMYQIKKLKVTTLKPIPVTSGTVTTTDIPVVVPSSDIIVTSEPVTLPGRIRNYTMN